MYRVRLNAFDRWIGNLVYFQQRFATGRVVWRFGRVVHNLLAWRGTDISPYARIGPGLRLRHGGIGVVIHGQTTIGRDVTIYQGVTIGRADVANEMSGEFQGVVVGDDVVIGAGAVIITKSRLIVANGSVIGANAVLTTSTGVGETWAGNPARKVSGPDPA